jgi:hypothetical protein
MLGFCVQVLTFLHTDMFSGYCTHVPKHSAEELTHNYSTRQQNRIIKSQTLS